MHKKPLTSSGTKPSSPSTAVKRWIDELPVKPRNVIEKLDGANTVSNSKFIGFETVKV